MSLLIVRLHLQGPLVAAGILDGDEEPDRT